MKLRFWLATLTVVAIGCSSTAPAVAPTGDDDDDDDTEVDRTEKKNKDIEAALKDAGLELPKTPAGGLLTMRPRELFTGFDGTHTYAAPFGVDSKSGEITVALSDPSAGTIAAVEIGNRVEGDTSKYYVLTAKKPGAYTIRASAGGKTGSIALTVASYDTAAWTVGSTRYTSVGVTGDPTCASCHAGGSGVDHSPAALARASDTDVGAVLVSGISTSGFPIKAGGEKAHRWDLTPEQRAGLVIYLRSLAPRGYETK